MEFRMVPTGVPGGLGSQFLFNAYKYLLEGGTVPEHFAESRTVFIHKTSDIDDNGRMDRSHDVLCALMLCNCDYKLLTSAICRGLHWYTMRWHNIFEIETTALAHVACAPQESGILLTDFAAIHPSQRCISSRQTTDNIFESETTALAHVACAPQESGILLTDFAAAYPSVTNCWIFSVLENTGLPDFLCRFLRSIYSDSTTYVEFAGADRGQFLMVRGVRQGCPASGFPFCNGRRPDLQMAPRDNYSKEPSQAGLLAACPMCLR